jgi:ABC-2 type transport system ATP-binding protein
MKMLTGIVVPSRGDLAVLDHYPPDRPEDLRRRIALVMGQKSQLWWDIPAQDSLELLRRYYEVPDADYRSRLAELAAMLEVEDLLHIHLRRLSLGERMKMELIACLLHGPEVLFLDEPTIGLDLVAQDSIRAFLRAWAEDHGTTILLTSHYMADVTALCRRIVLILGGEKRFDGSLVGFERLLGAEKVVAFHFAEPCGDHPLLADLHPVVRDEGRWVDVRIPEGELREVTARILTELPVIDFASEDLPIERVMKELQANPALAEVVHDAPQEEAAG